MTALIAQLDLSLSIVAKIPKIIPTQLPTMGYHNLELTSAKDALNNLIIAPEENRANAKLIPK